MDWHQLLMTGGTWIVGLAFPAGGLMFAYHAIMRPIGCGTISGTEEDRHYLHRMGQVALVTGGLVLVGVCMYGIGRFWALSIPGMLTAGATGITWLTMLALSAGGLMIGYQALLRTAFDDLEHIPLVAMKRIVIGCAIIAGCSLLLRFGAPVASVWWPITAS